MKNSYRHFTNRQCEYFPCHDAPDPEHFNCLFCYCPLYALGDKCGGNFTYTESGVKSCIKCSLPHNRNSYGYIMEQFSKIKELMQANKEESDEDAQ